MKRLVGVMILAGAPIACGTQTPSAPETTSLVNDVETAVASAQSQSKRAASCVVGDRTQIRGIELKVLASGRGFVTVRAVATNSVGPDTTLPICLDPSYVVTPNARVDRSVDPEQATIFAAPGRYMVKASSIVSKQVKPLTTQLGIVIQ